MEITEDMVAWALLAIVWIGMVWLVHYERRRHLEPRVETGARYLAVSGAIGTAFTAACVAVFYLLLTELLGVITG